ncbi:MAG: class I SAM-dependent methyltransferase [Candidatus Eisenbacteria bacterium]|nr:class I SAM-dependent methyltransferase [Candidatus Eisenbacteria bacterium]
MDSIPPVAGLQAMTEARTIRPPDRSVEPAYSRLAPHYDRVFGSYARELNGWLIPWIRRQDPRPDSVADLACGTGTTALALARVIPRVLAIDLRPEFTAIVRARAGKRAATRHIRTLVADMRTFRLDQPVQLLTCFFDALNHLPRPTNLLRTFRAVHRALEPGGMFLFDINTPWALKRSWPEMKALWKGKGWFAVARGRYVEGGQSAAGVRTSRGHGEFDIHWFERDRTGTYRPRVERFREIAWTKTEIRAALKSAGFVGIRTVDEPALAPFVGESGRDRTFWVARRGEGNSFRNELG